MIFLENFNTRHQTTPFSLIKLSDYKDSFKACISKAKNEIDAIIQNSEEPTFENVIAAIDFAGQELDRLSSTFFNLNSAETSDEMQKIAQEVSPWLTEFSNDITLNEDLFQKIKIVYDKKDSLNLTTEQQTLLDKKYKGFVRNGALLNEEQKTKLREIDTQLAKLKLTFGENVLAETNNYQLHITNESDLKGLPEGAKEAAAELAKSKNLEGW
ncbi:MAG: M3 family peptidase, partial [Flavobacteriaceae bacterium]|nr:M3 family peptidase [Flavobacteriaceae bacterium]